MKRIVKSTLICIMAVLLAMTNITNMVFAADGAVTSPNEKTTSTNVSDDNNFTVKQSVRWTNDTKTKGELEIELVGETITSVAPTPKDIIFITDVSGSMAGERFDNLKTAVHNSADVLLDSKYNNRLALISFSDTTKVESDFTNNKTDFQAKASGMSIGLGTFYSIGLIEAKKLIEARTDVTRTPVIVFMSDGETYDFTFNIQNISNQLQTLGVEMYAVQYMLGNEISPSIKALISNESNVYSTNNADHLNDLYKDVIQDVVNAEVYKDVSLDLNFEQQNFIVDSVSSNFGTSKSIDGKISWMTDNLLGQRTVKIKVNFSLQDSAYEGNLSINKDSQITYNDTSDKKIILDTLAINRELFHVSFDSNGASGGTVPNSITALEGQKIDIPENEGNLSKSGEVFAGWERNDTNKLISKSIVMPNNDFTLKAIWAKPEIEMNTSTVAELPRDRYTLKSGRLYQSLTALKPMSFTKIEFTHSVTAPADATVVDLSEDGSGNIIAWGEGTTLYIGSKGNVVAPVETSFLFQGNDPLRNIESINFNDMFKTDQTTNFENMFYSLGYLKELDIRGLDTSKGESFQGMFEMIGLHIDPSSVAKLDFSNFDTSNAKNMKYMFSSYRGEQLDLSNFVTNKVEKMDSMFARCTSLETLDLSSFNTVKMTNLNRMFEDCTKLTTAWARTETDKNKFNNSPYKAANVDFKVKSASFSLDTKAKATNNSNIPSMMSTRAAGGPVDIIDGVADAGKIKPNDEVDYDVTVKYTGATYQVKSGTMKVVNKLPENMTYVADSISIADPTRIVAGDGGSALGKVVNQKVEGNVLSFDVVGLSAGAQIKVGYKVTAPATPIDTYKEFLNQSTLTLEEIKTPSNYVLHYFSTPDPAAMSEVKYVYEGTVPMGAPALPSTRSFTTGQNVNTVEVGQAGYKFSGWTSDDVTVNADGSFTMPNKPVTLKGSWTEIPASKEIKSTVTYEFKGDVPTDVRLPKESAYTVGNNYNDVETITGKMINIVEEPSSTGYVFKGWSSDQLSADELTAGVFELGKDNVVIKGTWEKEKFTVEYKYLDAVPPTGAPTLPAAQKVAWGETVSTKEKIDDLTTYGFDGWYSNNNIGAEFKESFIMPQEDVTIYGYWIDLSTTHNITYEYEGETPDDAPSLGGKDTAMDGNASIVRSNPVSAQGTDKDGVIGKWVFNGWTSEDVTVNPDGTFTMIDRDITMKGSWTFEKNMNIRFVTFEIENGTWSDGDTKDKIVTVELVDGKTTLNEADVPVDMYANEGYTDGHWVVEPDTTTDGVTDSITYTYKYVKKPIVTFEIENGTWKDGTKTNKEIGIELVNGKGTLSEMDVPTGMIANAGYQNGYWVVKPDTSGNAVTKDIVYTYCFEKEVHVVFKITNGTWKDGSSADKDVIVLLKDGRGTLKDTQIPEGMKAKKGYGNGKWVVVPSADITGNVTYEYRYEKLDNPEVKDPTNPGKPEISTPENPDVKVPTEQEKNESNVTKTGDTMDWTLPIIGLLLSGLLVGFAWKKRTKKEVE